MSDRIDHPLTMALHAVTPPALRGFLTGEENELLKIPAKSPAVGDLSVLNDDVEYTVCIGTVYHSHFEVNRDAAGGVEAVARDVIEWIEAILADQIRFRHYFIGDRLAGASSWSVEDGEPVAWLKTATRWNDYCWSGPVGQDPPRE